MGKRKRATKPPPKPKAARLETIFDCPFCGHERTCEVFIDRIKNVGSVSCSVCGAEHSSNVNPLEEEVDVYANWIDANAKANELD